MIATYAAAAAVCGASLAIGQAAMALCGVRRWSWLAPAAGPALLCAIAWATVRLPGGGALTATVILALAVAAAIYLRGRVEGGGDALRAGLPVGLLALAAASLPFAIEGHFGILGTGFNPDMSQHLLAADRLSDDTVGELWRQGYPLGPHAVAVALEGGLGIGLVQGFGGFTVAVAVLASLTALTAFADQPPARRAAAALLVGIPYLVASYFAQGAFKETTQALLVLAFLLALRESERSWAGLPLRYVPAALIAVGSVYVYSFPGLVWLGAIALVWVLLERFRSWRALSLAAIVFVVGALPELGRMLDFQRFETFDPDGPGLGNLFGQVSPFTALGIWPSGDFRVAPGGGAVPAAAFYLGAAFASLLLLVGLVRCRQRRENAILAGVAAVAGIYLAARAAGTPYTAAKALEIAAPVLTLAILVPSIAGLRRLVTGMRPEDDTGAGGGGHGGDRLGGRSGPLHGLAAGAYLLAAGFCSLLALANAPVGPTSYSPALAELRPLIASGSTLVLAPDELLDREQGLPYLTWELRGGRVCVERAGAAGSGAPAPAGVAFVLTPGSERRPPFAGFDLRRRAGAFLLWERADDPAGPGPCPLIAVRQARQGDGG